MKIVDRFPFAFLNFFFAFAIINLNSLSVAGYWHLLEPDGLPLECVTVFSDPADVNCHLAIHSEIFSRAIPR